MNSLNSILIEGEVVSLNDVSVDDHSSKCELCIVSHRLYKVDDSYVTEDSYFTVLVDNSKMAETCLTYLHKDSGVRIVGRLKQEKWTEKSEYGDHDDVDTHSKIIIIAEHVEIKPEVK